MGVTGGGLDFEDALLNREERNIEGYFTEIENEDVTLAIDLLIETIGNGGCSGLVDDAEDVEARDRAGVPGGLTLRVVAVGGDGVLPRYDSAISFIFVRTIDEISSGDYDALSVKRQRSTYEIDLRIAWSRHGTEPRCKACHPCR